MINKNKTNDFTTSTKNYYNDLKRFNPIKSKDDELELIRLAQSGNKEAKNKIITSNLKFVFDIAKKYKGKGVNINDLISEGNNGLIIAINKYDCSKGTKFITYAVFWIRERILNAIECNNKQVYHERSLEDLTNQMHCRKNECIDYEDEDIPISEQIYPEIKTKYDYRLDEIENMFNVLNTKEKYVIKNFYGIGCEAQSLKNISLEMKISSERVRQIKLSSLRKMRNFALLSEKKEIFFA